jgi:ElaB/YqjD/DUF883 family membrane-anchored ribosome-binding protein
MANEFRGAREDVAATPAPGPVQPQTADPERQLPAEAEAAHRSPEYEEPDTARAEIEATRARMSETIDEIEDVLVRKKERIQSRLDVLAPVRENPWPSMGVALGAGLLVGLLTGGEEEDERPARPTFETGAWERRTEMLEHRTRRLLAIAREQEREIRRLRSRKRRRRAKPAMRHRVVDRLEEEYEDLSHRAAGARSRLEDVRHAVIDGLASFLTEAVRQLQKRR